MAFADQLGVEETLKGLKDPKHGHFTWLDLWMRKGEIVRASIFIDLPPPHEPAYLFLHQVALETAQQLVETGELLRVEREGEPTAPNIQRVTYMASSVVDAIA